MRKLIVSAVVLCTPILNAAEQSIMTTAMDAYIYGYPLVLMEVTKEAMTNVPKATESKAPINQFANMQTFPDPSFHNVVSPNADTLYSSAWLNLLKEPIVLSVPDTGDRYYLLPLMDAWTNIFSSIGTRTTGNKKGSFLIIGPYWKGPLPRDLKQIRSPTNLVWIIGRTKTNGPSDYNAVHAIQKQYKLTPLSSWGTSYTPPTDVPVNPEINTEQPPVDQVNEMDAMTFFQMLAQLLKTNPPSPEDEDTIDRFADIGLVPGNDYRPNLTPAQLGAVDRGVQKARERIAAAWKNQNFARKVNGWTLAVDDIGDYGTNYFLRAIIAYGGLGANLPEDAVYPATHVDSDGRPLNGRNQYVIHFDKGQFPPANAFWSITLYNDRQFFVANPLDRYAIGDRDRLKFNPDGSLDIYIQADAPGKEKESNWLPAPAGNFNLIMRLYAPKESVIDGEWVPPPVERV